MEPLNLQHASPKELDRQLAERREHVRALRFRIMNGQEKHVRELRSIRRDIARILTRRRQIQTKETVA